MKYALLIIAASIAAFGQGQTITNPFTGASGAAPFTREFRTVCQNGFAQSSFNVPASDPSTPACVAGTVPSGVTSVSANSASTLGYSFILPCTPNGSGGCNESSIISFAVSLDYRSADSTHAATVQPFYACVTTGSVTSPSYASAASSQSLTPAATSGRTIGQFTLSTSGCAPGNRYYGYLSITTNASATATFDVIAATFVAKAQ